MPTVFRLYSPLKSTPARVGANSFPFVQNPPSRSQEKLFASTIPLFSPNSFLWEYRRQCRRKQVCPVSLAYQKVWILDFGRTIAMSGHFLFAISLLASTFFLPTHRKWQLKARLKSVAICDEWTENMLTQ